jgi:hypothetical protein
LELISEEREEIYKGHFVLFAPVSHMDGVFAGKSPFASNLCFLRGYRRQLGMVSTGWQPGTRRLIAGRVGQVGVVYEAMIRATENG